MPIKIRLSSILGDKKLKMSEVSRKTGIGTSTLLRFYHERSDGIRFDVLEKLCEFLDCQPGDLLVYINDNPQPTPDEAQNGLKTRRQPADR
jgi:putative transcriptional regulator